MRNRVLRIIICFALIFSLVFCEATMCFATIDDIDPNTDAVKAEVSEVVLKDHEFEKGQVYTYTGEQIAPVLTRVVVDITYKNEDGSYTKEVKEYFEWAWQ